MRNSSFSYRIFLQFLLLLCSSYICAQQSSISTSHKFSISEGIGSPVRIAIDNQDMVYVTDNHQHSIVKFSNSGEILGTIYPGGSPLSIAISNENQIFIGDGETGAIFRLNETGTTTEFYSETLFPSSMIFSPDNLLYVIDSELKRVVVLDMAGNVVQTIGNGILILPTGIAYDHINERIFVSEHGGIGTGFNPVVKIWVFDLQGNLLHSIGSHGSGEGQFYRIQGMTIGRCGKLFATDPFQGTISVFDESGFITSFGEYGDELGQLNAPLDIVADSHGYVWITSMNNGSVEVFKIDEISPSSNIILANTILCPGGTTDISIDLTGSAPWTLIYTIDGSNPTTINNVEDNPFILSVSNPGIYEVIALSDANDTATCLTGMADIRLNPLPAVEFTYSENQMEVSFLNNSSNANSYSWDFGDNETSDEVNPVHLYKETGTYDVVLTAFNVTCGTSVKGNSLIVLGTEVERFRHDNFVKIYPNPSSGRTRIEFSNPVQFDLVIEVTNIKGQAIYSEHFAAPGTVTWIDLSDIPKGIYTVRFISNKFFSTKKLVLTE